MSKQNVDLRIAGNGSHEVKLARAKVWLERNKRDDQEPIGDGFDKERLMAPTSFAEAELRVALAKAQHALDNGDWDLLDYAIGDINTESTQFLGEQGIVFDE